MGCVLESPDVEQEMRSPDMDLGERNPLSDILPQVVEGLLLVVAEDVALGSVQVDLRVEVLMILVQRLAEVLDGLVVLFPLTQNEALDVGSNGGTVRFVKHSVDVVDSVLDVSGIEL